MLGLALALGVGGLAYALAKDRGEGRATATTEAAVTGGGATGSGVVVAVEDGGVVSSLPREGASTPPEDFSAGQSGSIIEMPPMIIERGTQKPAQKPVGGKKPHCACVKAPCNGCGPMGGKGTAAPSSPIPAGGLGGLGGSAAGGSIGGGFSGATKPNFGGGATKPNPKGGGFFGGGQKPTPTPTIYTPLAVTATKGLTPTAAGDRIKREYQTTGGNSHLRMIF